MNYQTNASAQCNNVDNIIAMYDSECPICRFGVKNYKVNESQHLDIIDIRVESVFRAQAAKLGYNLDKTIVIKAGDNFYAGGEALAFMAKKAKRTNFFSKILYKIVAVKSFSKAIYPILSYSRSALLWLRNVPSVYEKINEFKGNIIKNQLGDDWHKLNANIQARFIAEPKLESCITYNGTMEVVECSKAGKLFAHLTSIISNPLTPYEGKNIPMDVRLEKRKGLSGTYWSRTYYYPNKQPYTITSAKRQNSAGTMTECVGGGFGMELIISESNGNLQFKSTKYFWQFKNIFITIPDILTPGQTNVLHEDLGDGNFRFTISMTHKLLGKTFYQTGIFNQK